MIAALCILPWAGGGALLSFDGDLVLFAGLLALMRFVTIIAALDTGSAFEGMGASREAWFSSLGRTGAAPGPGCRCPDAGKRVPGRNTRRPLTAVPGGAAAVIFLVTCCVVHRVPGGELADPGG